MKLEEYERSFTASRDDRVYAAHFLSAAPQVSGFVGCQWLWLEVPQEYVLVGRKPRRRGEPRDSGPGLQEILRLQPGEVLAFTRTGDPVAIPVPRTSGEVVDVLEDIEAELTGGAAAG